MLNYRADIDGLRAIAVVSVFLYHINSSLLPGGFVGVDIFFVISGYVITAQILKAYQNTNFSFINFYYRRIKRILPALYFMLFICSIAAILMLYPSDYRKFFSVAKKVVLMIPNLYYLKSVDYFEPVHDTSPLLHTWSLGVEEQLYLLYPLILVTCLKKLDYYKSFLVLLSLLILSFALSEYLTIAHKNHAFYMTYSRAWEFIIGGLLSFNIIPQLSRQYSKNIVASLGVIIILFVVLFYTSNTHFPGLGALLPCLGTALVVYSGIGQQTPIHHVLSSKIFTFNGKLSYSLYLWHWPIIIFYTMITGKGLSFNESIVIIFIAYLMALISLRFIEEPIRYRKIQRDLSRCNSIATKFGFTISNHLAVIFNTVLLLIIIPLGMGLLGSQYKAKWRVANANSQITSKNNNKYASDIDNYQGILIGDSHAVHYYKAVAAWANQYNIAVKLQTHPACPDVLVDYTIESKDQKVIKGCKTHIKKVAELIETNQDIKYVFLTTRADKHTQSSHQASEYEQALELTVKKLVNMGKKVAILDQVPIFKSPPFYTTIWDKIFDKTRVNSTYANIDYEYINYKLATSRRIIKNIVTKYNIDYFDGLQYITAAHDKGISLYGDDNHLSLYGSKYLEKYFHLPKLESELQSA